MLLEFMIYELISESRFFKILVTNKNKENEFVVVGTKKEKQVEYYKCHQLDEDGFRYIGDKIDEFTHLIPMKDMKIKGDASYSTIQMDIPKKKLTLNTVDNIINLNMGAISR